MDSKKLDSIESALEQLTARQMGLVAAVSLIADLHPNRAALIAAYPAVLQAMQDHTLYSRQSESSREQAAETLAGALRIPRGI